MARAARKTRQSSKSIKPKRRIKPRKARLTSSTPLSGADRAQRAIDLYKQGNPYPMGCSGFVCDVLQISQRQAAKIMGADVGTNSIGTAPKYTNVKPGDICGWVKADSIKTPKHDHVAVYIGKKGMVFIDVHMPASPGLKPRKLSSGYGKQPVWKSKNF